MKKKGKVFMIIYCVHSVSKDHFLTNQNNQTSKTCIDHMIKTEEHKTDTLETTIGDHFAVTAETT